MNSLAFVFPGQGAQKVGMGYDLKQNSSLASDIFRKADEILGYSISKMCFEGPAEELKLTLHTQPAIFVMSMAVYETLRHDLVPAVVAGHSVGEYAALTAAGVLNFSDALTLVRKRAELMHNASIDAPGTMAAIIGLDYESIKKCCMEAYAAGVVEVANFNSPDQIVISGECAAVERAMELAREKGAKRTMPLNVSAAFHSRLMKKAAEELALDLDRVHFSNASVPVAMNYTAEVLTEGRLIKEALKKQMRGSVLWVDSIKAMVACGADTFVEAGPGKALCGMIRKIDPSVSTWNVEDMNGLYKIMDSMAVAVA